ncbi:hypothetical protein SARC_17813 [Sphaeroforma arctica JP610]|uniref:Uncharacterized protein n=1 Tax=Sphaeroforma arctica JP610 TaxID=667725 RepID=A0A0L0EZ39_9EUKA|nr:hypothetical protein SARC_17813 [Sphaeroforma arctica JP610]KNC69671.1 hypothetical protein SARC_17813 [Sphaeroforma arctica JP610]|eukprot:XP_014143573.1 hypothetical protein SARC_17813 [Sphaeroforma arctica JP610]
MDTSGRVLRFLARICGALERISSSNRDSDRRYTCSSLLTLWASANRMAQCDGLECDELVCDGLVCDGLMCEELMSDGLIRDGLMRDGLMCEGLMCDGLMCDGLMCDAIRAMY